METLACTTKSHAIYFFYNFTDGSLDLSNQGASFTHGYSASLAQELGYKPMAA